MDTQESKKYGERIKKARERAGFTQEQVATKAGLKSTNYFAIIERGEVTTSPVNLRKIAKALDIDISEIIK